MNKCIDCGCYVFGDNLICDYCREDRESCFYDDDEDRSAEDEYAMALSCTCGAFQIGKDGKVYHVADCCCGAE